MLGTLIIVHLRGTSFGQKGEGPGEINYPSGLAVDVSGVVYVCDYNNNRFQLFSQAEQVFLLEKNLYTNFPLQT